MLYVLTVYIILYSLSLLFAIQCKNIGKRKSIWKSYPVYLLIFTFTFIVGLRWDVGVDYMGYYYLYIGDYQYNSFDRLELIPRSLMNFFNSIGLPFYSWFMAMAFFQILFLIKAFEKYFFDYLPLGVFFFLIMYLALDMNVVRQGVALSIALYSYTFIKEKRIIPFLFFGVLAFFFHKSAVLITPLFLFAFLKRFPGPFFQLALFIFFIFLGQLILDKLISISGPYWDLLQWGHKVDQLADNEWEIEEGTGMGVLITYIRYSIMIIFSQQALKRDTSSNVLIFYYIFFVGACFYSVTKNDMLLSRLNDYFLICDVLVSAVFIKIWLSSKNFLNIAAATICMLANVAWFASNLLRSEWQFVWD